MHQVILTWNDVILLLQTFQGLGVRCVNCERTWQQSGAFVTLQYHRDMMHQMTPTNCTSLNLYWYDAKAQRRVVAAPWRNVFACCSPRIEMGKVWQGIYLRHSFKLCKNDFPVAGSLVAAACCLPPWMTSCQTTTRYCQKGHSLYPKKSQFPRVCLHIESVSTVYQPDNQHENWYFILGIYGQRSAMLNHWCFDRYWASPMMQSLIASKRHTDSWPSSGIQTRMSLGWKPSHWHWLVIFWWFVKLLHK